MASKNLVFKDFLNNTKTPKVKFWVF